MIDPAAVLGEHGGEPLAVDVVVELLRADEQRAADAGVSIEEATSTLLGEKQPSHDFVTPEQLGEVAVFLCTDAAAQVRGAAWTVDGGWCAQ